LDITGEGSALRRLFFIIVTLLAAFIAGVFLWRYLGSDKATIYVTTPVTIGAVTRTITATGTVNPVQTIIVGSYVSGSVQQLYCDYNTRVRQAQICAKIDPRPYQTVVDGNKANLDVAKAQLAKDKSNLEYAKLNSTRLAGLAVMDAVSKDAADNARNAYNQALAQVAYDEAQIEERQAQLAASLVNLEYTNIASPVSGTVISRNVTMGQTVASSFQTPTLFLIATDLTKMQVDTNVSESDIGGVRVGDRATFTVDTFPRRTFTGIVKQVRQSPQTVQNVVTFDIVVSVDNTDLALKPGLTAATRIIVDERQGVVRVPDQALRYSPTQGEAARAPAKENGGSAVVWLLRDGKPVAQTIKTGLDDDTFTEVVEGLKASDQVIVSERLASAKSRLLQPKL
jgi:HlyD family secretion protein